MRSKRVGLAVLAVGFLVLLLWWWLAPSLVQAPPQAAPTPVVGEAGTVFGPLPTATQTEKAAVAAASLPPPPPDDDALRLWPHLRQGEPTREHQTQVQAQWNRFAQAHPDNLYLPAYLQSSLTPEQVRAARQRLDNTTAVATQMAVQSHAARYLQPGQEPPPAPAAPVDPAVQRDFLDYKIRELESRLQLVQFYLTNGKPSADKRAAANKDIKQWTQELESLRQARAAVPNT